MPYWLQRHPFPVKAHFQSSLVLAYAVPQTVLTPMLGPGLTLDTYGDYGLLAIALVQTRNLRPAYLPAGLGIDFHLSGYRIFTRYRTPEGRTLRGLRILRSDTDKCIMQVFGNLLTHYGYERSSWKVERNSQKYCVQVNTPSGIGNLEVEADLEAPPELPEGSPFPDLREARKFAGPLPFTFDYERETHSMIRIQGVRQQWNPRPVRVTVRQNSFLQQKQFRDANPILANAFFLEDVPYAWRPGIREPLS